MTRQNTDHTFFTNGPHQTLLDRFKATLADTSQLGDEISPTATSGG